MAESSLAADLLADFNDTDEEDLNENGTSDISQDLSDQPNGHRSRSHDFMELDGDEEADEDEDEKMTGVGREEEGKKAPGDLSIDDDEETTKAKVEGMHLAGVDDVRSVAGLMKKLEPVLRACHPSMLLLRSLLTASL
jgi:U4/U6 small nuclear ribonucleoprotein PRP31